LGGEYINNVLFCAAIGKGRLEVLNSWRDVDTERVEMWRNKGGMAGHRVRN